MTQVTRDQRRALEGFNARGGIGHWEITLDKHAFWAPPIDASGSIVVTCQPTVGPRQYRLIRPNGSTSVLHPAPTPDPPDLAA